MAKEKKDIIEIHGDKFPFSEVLKPFYDHVLSYFEKRVKTGEGMEDKLTDKQKEGLEYLKKQHKICQEMYNKGMQNLFDVATVYHLVDKHIDVVREFVLDKDGNLFDKPMKVQNEKYKESLNTLLVVKEFFDKFRQAQTGDLDKSGS